MEDASLSTPTSLAFPIDVFLHESHSAGTANVTLLQQLNDEVVVYLIPAIILNVVNIAVGTAGNSLVLHVFLNYFRESSSRDFIITLAWLDLIIVLCLQPLSVFLTLHPLVFSHVYTCKTYRLLENTFIFGSLFVLVVIAVDRYLKTVRPFYRARSTHVRIACCLPVVLGFLVNLPAAISLFGISRPKTRVPGVSGYVCFKDEAARNTPIDKTYDVFYTAFLAAIFVLLVALYTRVWYALKKRRETQIGSKVSQEMIARLMAPKRSGFVEDPGGERSQAGDTGNPLQLGLATSVRPLSPKPNAQGSNTERAEVTAPRPTDLATTTTMLTQADDDDAAEPTTSTPQLPATLKLPSARKSSTIAERFTAADMASSVDYPLRLSSSSTTTVFNNASSTALAIRGRFRLPRNSVNRTTASLITVSAFFFFSYFSAGVALHFQHRLGTGTRDGYPAYGAMHFFLSVAFLQHAVNPFIYYFFNKRFRAVSDQVIRRLFSAGFCGRSPPCCKSFSLVAD